MKVVLFLMLFANLAQAQTPQVVAQSQAPAAVPAIVELQPSLATKNLCEYLMLNASVIAEKEVLKYTLMDQFSRVYQVFDSQHFREMVSLQFLTHMSQVDSHVK